MGLMWRWRYDVWSIVLVADPNPFSLLGRVFRIFSYYKLSFFPYFSLLLTDDVGA